MNFFYDEINKLANESVGITGNISLDQSTETNDLIYGKLNKEVETNVYQGTASKNTVTIVDNEKNTIKVDINKEALSEDFVNHNTLNTSNKLLSSTIENKTGALSNRLDTLQTDIENDSATQLDLINTLRTDVDGILENYVTTNTDQHIEGIKTFYSYINIAEGAASYPEIRSDKMLAIKPDVNTSNKEKHGYYFRYANLDPIPNASLGSKEVPWKDLFLKGNLSDGTSSVSISEIVSQTMLSSKINRPVLFNSNLEYSDDTVQIVRNYVNLYSAEETASRETVLLADESHAGLMAKGDYTSLRNLESRVGNLEGKTSRILYKNSQNPTADEINTFVLSLGKFELPFEGVAVVIDETYHIWRYYENINTWKDDGVDSVNLFTNDMAGILIGSETPGKVFAETDGTGSVYGWDELTTRVSNNESNIIDLYAKLPRVYRLVEA